MTERVEPPVIACTLSTGDLETRLAWIAELNRTALLSERRDGLRLELTYVARLASKSSRWSPTNRPAVPS
jgi:hypothetical protein